MSILVAISVAFCNWDMHSAKYEINEKMLLYNLVRMGGRKMIEISLEKKDIVPALMATSILMESVFRMENEEGNFSCREGIGEILCGIIDACVEAEKQD